MLLCCATSLTRPFIRSFSHSLMGLSLFTRTCLNIATSHLTSSTMESSDMLQTVHKTQHKCCASVPQSVCCSWAAHRFFSITLRATSRAPRFLRRGLACHTIDVMPLPNCSPRSNLTKTICSEYIGISRISSVSSRWIGVLVKNWELMNEPLPHCLS